MKSDFETFGYDRLSLEDPEKRARLMQLLCYRTLGLASYNLAWAGLYAAGELVGGVFYFNYPGGAGLMSGSVFGRLAGSAAVA